MARFPAEKILRENLHVAVDDERRDGKIAPAELQAACVFHGERAAAGDENAVEANERAKFLAAAVYTAVALDVEPENAAAHVGREVRNGTVIRVDAEGIVFFAVPRERVYAAQPLCAAAGEIFERHALAEGLREKRFKAAVRQAERIALAHAAIGERGVWALVTLCRCVTGLGGVVVKHAAFRQRVRLLCKGGGNLRRGGFGGRCRFCGRLRRRRFGGAAAGKNQQRGGKDQTKQFFHGEISRLEQSIMKIRKGRPFNVKKNRSSPGKAESGFHAFIAGRACRKRRART